MIYNLYSNIGTLPIRLLNISLFVIDYYFFSLGCDHIANVNKIENSETLLITIYF